MAFSANPGAKEATVDDGIDRFDRYTDNHPTPYSSESSAVPRCWATNSDGGSNFESDPIGSMTTQNATLSTLIERA
jgi:hypothetical protein